MNNSVDELITALNALYAFAETNECTEEYEDGREYFTSNNSIYLETAGLANVVLIDDYGCPDRDNMKLLEQAGFRVFPGETDSFGWLTGCIQKKGSNKILVFG